jgi:hypothetical protein
VPEPGSDASHPGEESGWEPVTFSRPARPGYEWQSEPVLVLFDQGERINGALFYSPRKLAPSSAAQFGAAFVSLLRKMVDQTDPLVRDVPLHE